MTYLTRWRLQLAAQSLKKTSRGIAEIATDIGYESEAAFSRAFKREFGQAPGRYRSAHKGVANPNGQRTHGIGRNVPAVE
jgi:AraC-like DNA-binding protein